MRISKPVGNAPQPPVAGPAPAPGNYFAGQSRLRAFALIVVAVLVAYHNILPNAFVFDDKIFIVENAQIRHLWPPWEILTQSSRPVVTLSLAVNYAFGGLNPPGYHVVNVMVHILAALVLYGIVRRTLLSDRLRSRFGPAADWLALAIALIWAVHPLQTESVTYTYQRAESLMGLFYLLTLYCVIRSRDSARAAHWQMAAVVSCVLGMASKPVMVSAPIVVLLYDRAYWAQSWNEIWQRRWKLYAGLMSPWLLLPGLVAVGNLECGAPTAGFAFKGISPGAYALTQPGVIVHYLRLSFWPRPLILDYGWHYPLARSVGDAWPGLLVVGGLLAATVWAWRRQPELGFLGAWFFLILGITSSFMPIADVVFEHRMYLSLAAVVTLVVMGLYSLAGRRSVVMFALVAIGFGFLTVQRNKDYRSELTIWTDTVAKWPQNSRAHANLGGALAQQGNLPAAIEHCERALQIQPDYAEAHNNLGVTLARQGKWAEAIPHYERALQLEPEGGNTRYNLANALAQQGKLTEAIQYYEQTLQRKPDAAEAHNNLAFALVKQGRWPEALAHFERALQLNPEDAGAHNNLGLALVQQGRGSEAIPHFERALQLNPAGADTHYHLGNALAAQGQWREAIQHYEQSLQLKPDSAKAAGTLAWLLATCPDATLRNPAKSLRLAQRARELTPVGNPTVLDTLAAAQAAGGDFVQAMATAREALALATVAGKDNLAREIEVRLALYQAGQPYYEPPADSNRKNP